MTIGAATMSASCSSSSPAPSAPCPARITVFLPALSSVGRRAKSSCARHDDRRPPHVRRVALDVLLRRLVVLDCLFLDVDRAGDVRDAASESAARQRGVDQRCDVRGAEDLLVVDGDVLEQRQQVDFLLIVRADQVVVRLAGDREHRRAVHLGVVQAVQQVDGAGARGGEADAEPAGVLRIAAGHERRGFLVAHLDERMRSCRVRSASMMPLMPSPGRPKTTCTPQSISRSARHICSRVSAWGARVQ